MEKWVLKCGYEIKVYNSKQEALDVINKNIGYFPKTTKNLSGKEYSLMWFFITKDKTYFEGQITVETFYPDGSFDFDDYDIELFLLPE